MIDTSAQAVPGVAAATVNLANETLTLQAAAGFEAALARAYSLLGLTEAG